MARIRTIKPEIWTDEKFMAVSHGARLLFIGMFNFADDNGALVHSITELRVRIFPGDEKPEVQVWLTELIKIGLVIDYEVEGQKYLLVKGLRTHQVIDKPRKSNLPLPPSVEINGNQLKSTDLRKEGRKGRERKGRERKGRKEGGKGASPEPPGGGNGDARPAAPAYACECFEISREYLAELVQGFPEVPEDYLLKVFFPAMRDWCLDNRKQAEHRAKFENKTGRLRNPRKCFRTWLQKEAPEKIARWQGEARARATTTLAEPEGIMVPAPGCTKCKGKGLTGEGPCNCLRPDGQR